MCKVLKVSSSAYYDWKAGRSTKRVKREKQLATLIIWVWEESRHTYGSPRVWDAIKQMQVQISRSLVARIMRKYGLKSVHAKKFRVTTDSEHSFPVSKNILNREFSATRPGEKWVSDITYIYTKEGWLYLTTVIDLFDRKLIGWSFSTGMKAIETIVPAWRMACLNRPVKRPLLFHSDRGVQYACKTFRNLIKSPLITQSMSRKGNCWDNAVAESFFKTLKVERVYQTVYKTRKEAKMDIFQYIEGWYNSKRFHSTIGRCSINQFLELQKINYIRNVA